MSKEDIARAQSDAAKEAASGEEQFNKEPVRSFAAQDEPYVYEVFTGDLAITRFLATGAATTYDLTATGINLEGVLFTVTGPATITVIHFPATLDGTQANIRLDILAGTPAGDYDINCSLRDQGPIRKKHFRLRRT